MKIGWLGDVIYLLCDYGAFNMTTQSFNERPGKIYKCYNNVHSRTYRKWHRIAEKLRRDLLKYDWISSTGFAEPLTNHPPLTYPSLSMDRIGS
jgi:hypothetical protein